MNLREEFNRLDHEALLNDEPYYDLRNMLESVQLSQKDKMALKQFVDRNDADGAHTYLQGLLAGGPADSQQTTAGQPLTASATAEIADELEELEELEESRATLTTKPLKTKKQNSGKTRYEIIDTETNTPAVYVTPYTYDSQSSAKRAIADDDNNFNYLDSGRSAINPEYIKDKTTDKKKGKKEMNKGNKSKADLDESLFLEADVHYNRPDSYIDGVDTSEEDVNCMLGSPTKKDGSLWVEAQILLALYRDTILSGAPYVQRSTLLADAGVPKPDQTRQAQTYFNYFKELELATQTGSTATDLVYPGKELENWVKGKVLYFPVNSMLKANGKSLAGLRYGSGIDLSNRVGDVFQQRPEQGSMPSRSVNGRIPGVHYKSTANSATVAQQAASYTDEEIDDIFKDLFGESLISKQAGTILTTEDFTAKPGPALNADKPAKFRSFNDVIKDKWRAYLELEDGEDYPFKPYVVKTGKFEIFCFNQNIEPSKASKILFGDDYTGLSMDKLKELSK